MKYLLRVVLVAWCALSASNVFAQARPPVQLFAVDTNGTVRSVVIATDGSLVIGGAVTITGTPAIDSEFPAGVSDGDNKTAAASTPEVISRNYCYDDVGVNWDRCVAADPCVGVAKSKTAISLTADTVIIGAVASKKNYICSIAIVAGAAEIVSITEGDAGGSVCGTNEVALVGSTTDANGMSFAANGGIASIGGYGTAIPGTGTNVDTCLNVSGSNRVAGWVTWVQK